MRTVALPFSASGQQNWLVDEDTVLLGVSQSNSTANASISRDPNVNVAVAPSLYSTEEIGIVAQISGSRDLQIPFLKDSRVYVSASAAVTVYLYLSDRAAS